MVGVQTNIVTVADATPSQSADSPYLPGFVRATAEHFHIREVSADAVVDAGGVPYIDFKKVAKARAKGRKPDELWAQMYHMFTLNTAEFKRHYHKRSNVETTFHMIKSKFSDKVRAKTDTAQVNEVLMKVLCHNVCVLIRAHARPGNHAGARPRGTLRMLVHQKRPLMHNHSPYRGFSSKPGFGR